MRKQPEPRQSPDSWEGTSCSQALAQDIPRLLQKPFTPCHGLLQVPLPPQGALTHTTAMLFLEAADTSRDNKGSSSQLSKQITDFFRFTVNSGLALAYSLTFVSFAKQLAAGEQDCQQLLHQQHLHHICTIGHTETHITAQQRNGIFIQNSRLRPS